MTTYIVIQRSRYYGSPHPLDGWSSVHSDIEEAIEAAEVVKEYVGFDSTHIARVDIETGSFGYVWSHSPATGETLTDHSDDPLSSQTNPPWVPSSSQ